MPVVLAARIAFADPGDSSGMEHSRTVQGQPESGRTEPGGQAGPELESRHSCSASMYTAPQREVIDLVSAWLVDPRTKDDSRWSESAAALDADQDIAAFLRNRSAV